MKNIEEIAAALQGYDPQALRADDVNRFLAELVAPVPQTETVALMQALGRVLATDIISPISVPPHDNSAMDGYAFRGAALHPGQPLTLRPAGSTAFAGKAWQGNVGPDECVRIMTGAIMPAGLDTVVPQELTQTDANGHIVLPPDVVRPGDNRRLAGEDLMGGQPALRAGQRLTPAALGLVASLGLPTVQVFRRLTVAYFSTGDEILSLGEPVREGAVFDSNRYTVFGLLTRLGIEVIDMGVVPDQPERLEAAFRQAAARADAVITSGGVSVGEADHTKAMMRKLAAEDPCGHSGVVFWRIAMRPGRPMAVGRLGQSILFGLPGNPVAVMVTFLAFVRPALLRMMGCNDAPQPYLKARSQEVMRKKPGRTEYQRAIVSRASDGTLHVRSTGNQGSGVLRSMVEANGLVVLHHAQGNVAAGDEVDVLMFEGVT